MSMAMEYRGFLLTAVEGPAGGYQVEIRSIDGGKSVLTSLFAERAAAMTSAQNIVDNGVLGPPGPHPESGAV